MMESISRDLAEKTVSSGLRVLKMYLPTPARTTSCISNLATQFCYVEEHVKTRDLIEDLKRFPDLWAVGVVDKKGEGIGVIVVSQFQAKLSLPFANDVLGKRFVKEMMIKVRTFSWDKHVLTVADHLESEVEESRNSYYLLKNSSGSFAGIFSSKDLLIEMFKTYRQDLKLAVSIQSEMVPEQLYVQGKGLDIFCWCKMAKGVGGDYYACRQYKEGRWAMMVCDVSGKGMAASLVTTALGGMFSLYDFEDGMKGFIRSVNDFVLQTFKMDKYLTGVFLDYVEKDRRLTVFDMGHGHLRLVRNGKSYSFASRNPFLGFVPNVDPIPRAGVLHPGDLLVAYTDGFVEQQNREKEEFGVDQFERIIEKNEHEGLEKLTNIVHTSVKEFRGEQPRGDDLTLLLMRV